MKMIVRNTEYKCFFIGVRYVQMSRNLVSWMLGLAESPNVLMSISDHQFFLDPSIVFKIYDKESFFWTL